MRVKAGLSKVEELNVKINTSCHTKRKKMTKESNCFVNGLSEVMVNNGVYESTPRNHIQRAEYFNKVAEETCGTGHLEVVVGRLRKTEFMINYDCFLPSHLHRHVKQFYMAKFDGKQDFEILDAPVAFPAWELPKKVWSGFSEEALVSGIANEFGITSKEARGKILLARKSAAWVRGRSRSDDYVVFAFMLENEVRALVRGKKKKGKKIIEHDVKVNACDPFSNGCNCKRGRNPEKTYCDGYGGAMARFIDDGNMKDITNGLGNQGNEVERVLKEWVDPSGCQKLLVKLKTRGWGVDLEVLTYAEFKINNNDWPLQWYRAYMDACIVGGGRYCHVYG